MFRATLCASSQSCSKHVEDYNCVINVLYNVIVHQVGNTSRIIISVIIIIIIINNDGEVGGGGGVCGGDSGCGGCGGGGGDGGCGGCGGGGDGGGCGGGDGGSNIIFHSLNNQ